MVWYRVWLWIFGKVPFSPGVRKIFIGDPSIEPSGNESVSTSWNSPMRELRRACIWFDSVSILRRGKPSGMTFNLLRSLKPTMRSFLIAGDTTADVLICDDGAWRTISTTPAVGTGSPLTDTNLGGGWGLVIGIFCFNAMSEDSNVVALPVSGKQEKGKEPLRWEMERGKRGVTSSSSRSLGWASVTLLMFLPTWRLRLSERHTVAMWPAFPHLSQQRLLAITKHTSPSLCFVWPQLPQRPAISGLEFGRPCWLSREERSGWFWGFGWVRLTGAITLGLFLYGVNGSKLSCVLPDKLFDVVQSIHFWIEDFLPKVIITAGREELENRYAIMVKGLNVCL